MVFPFSTSRKKLAIGTGNVTTKGFVKPVPTETPIFEAFPFIVSGLRTIAANEVPLTAICTSINENYEGRISHVRSDISTFSGGTVLEGTLQIIPFEHNRSAADASRAMLLTSKGNTHDSFSCRVAR